MWFCSELFLRVRQITFNSSDMWNLLRPVGLGRPESWGSPRGHLCVMGHLMAEQAGEDQGTQKWGDGAFSGGAMPLPSVKGF